MKLNNIVKIAVVLLVLIGVVFYINKAPQKIKVAEANKTAPERVSALNYKGSMVIQKVTNIEDIMAELNNEPTAGSGTFDPAMIASEITAELTKAFSDSKEHSLPLVANWNVGLPVYEDGLDPMYMMSRLEMGEHVLVSWKLDPYYNDNVDISYYEDSIKKAATLKLPLVFVVDAPESALYKDDFYSGLPKERNPNVITNDGDVLAKLSPFAPSDVWKEVGEQWSSTNLMQQIQEWYPNPPMVLFVSKDEATKLAWSEVSLASRYTLENKDDNFKRTLIDAEWVEKYRQMYEGFKAGFVQTSWKENTKFISFNRLSEKMGATQNWDENATYTNYYTNIWPLTADGLSVDFTLGGESSDVSGDAPHIYANNLPFMLQEAKTVNSSFAYQLNLDAKGKIDDPVRYRGFSQFALWFLRPSIIRQATQETQKDAIEPTFKEIIDSAELIHYNAQLADFWRNGELVRNGASDLNRAIPNEFSDAPRWFLLNADLNPARPWNSDTEISVWAFALVKGEAPNREWLLYAQSPSGDKKDVTIDIPGYKSVMVDVTQMGSFYVLKEGGEDLSAVETDNVEMNPYLEKFTLPTCDANNPEVFFIKSNEDWSHINDKDKTIFCVAPGDYSSLGAIKLTTSGSAEKRRYIVLDNGNDLHPASLDESEQANVRIYFNSANYWILDRLSDLNNKSGYLMRIEYGSSHNVINRYYAKNYYNGVRILPNSNYNTIQNSYIDTSTHEGRLGDSVAIGIILNNDNEVVYGTKIINNDIKNAGDGIQLVSNRATQGISGEGTIIDNNNIWCSAEIYTDGNYKNDGYSNNPLSLYKIGEDGMDLKFGSKNPEKPVIITNNRVWGYIQGDPTAIGKQTIAPGVAIMAHFYVENVKFENNIIFNSDQSIVAGDDGGQPLVLKNWSIKNNIFANIGNKRPNQDFLNTFLIYNSKNISISYNSFIDFTPNTDGKINRGSIRLQSMDGVFNNNLLVKTFDLIYKWGNTEIANENYYYQSKEIIQNDISPHIYSSEEEANLKDFSFIYERYTKNKKIKEIKGIISTLDSPHFSKAGSNITK